MKEVRYNELYDTVEGKVKKIFSSGNPNNPILKIEIENFQRSSPIEKLIYNNPLAPAVLRYGDHIRAHYLNAKKISRIKRLYKIEYSYITRTIEKEECVDMIEILNKENVVATYGYLSDKEVKMCESTGEMMEKMKQEPNELEKIIYKFISKFSLNPEK